MAFLTPDKVYEMNGVTVKDYFLTEHNPNKIEMPTKRTKALLGITIHNTENITSAKGTTKAEQYVRATVNGNMGDVRVHYYVDETEAWHCLPDNWIGWHAADGANGNGNTATIAIEVIGDSEKSEDNAARLVAALMKQYNLTTDNLYTHSHWLNVKDGKTGTREYLNTLRRNGKNCPAYILPHWTEFEGKVRELCRSEKKVIYRVQVGAYSVRENAEAYLEKVNSALQKEGLGTAFIAKVEVDV